METKTSQADKPDASYELWKDMLDLGYEMAVENLIQMGRSREEAVRTLAQWLDRESERRWDALQRMVRRLHVDGQ